MLQFHITTELPATIRLKTQLHRYWTQSRSIGDIVTANLSAGTDETKIQYDNIEDYKIGLS